MVIDRSVTRSQQHWCLCNELSKYGNSDTVAKTIYLYMEKHNTDIKYVYPNEISFVLRMLGLGLELYI